MIFLSASIPKKYRAAIYYDTADNIAIREAVKALTAVLLSRQQLVWGGHPAISPLIKYVLESQQLRASEQVILYRSLYFRDRFEEYSGIFGKVVLTKKLEQEEPSLELMRREMIGSYNYQAGVFIGGMEGVEKEYAIFRELHPHVPAYPVASTGAAARILFNREKPERYQDELQDEQGYYALFTRLFGESNVLDQV